jgi:hypothetical protein
MKFQIQLSTFGLIATLAACGGAGEAPEGTEGFEDGTEQSDAAATTADPCAMGANPNFVSNQLTNVGATATYVRSYQWIDSICPSMGKDRKTTIVDFRVPGYFQHQTPETYRFDVQPSFDAISSTSHANVAARMGECVALSMATRVQRRNNDGSLTDLKYEEKQGEWVWDNILAGVGHCRLPTFYYTRENYLNAQQTETSTYRVRTWARRADGSHETVWITGTHTGL